MEEPKLLPQLFRSEYQKIVSVLCYQFGLAHIEIAEDIVSDTFLTATETWSISGLPENPVAWLYTVAKNKTKNYFKRSQVFEKLSPEIRRQTDQVITMEPDLSVKNIADSQLAMIFTVCHPAISDESQVALALNLLCGFGIQEIADAYLTNRTVIYKRLQRAKEKLKNAHIQIVQPAVHDIDNRLGTVLTTLYLLFSEGYYSTAQDNQLRKDLCAEAMRLVYLLIENTRTNRPEVNALMALMCFHASRFEARLDGQGEIVLYEDQDESLWDKDLINKGCYLLGKAAHGDQLSKFHVEAGIAYWHTQKEDSPEKWENILQFYNHLLIIEYSPVIALNRTFALAKVKGKPAAIPEAEKLALKDNHFYHSLLGHLYEGIDQETALLHFQTALDLATTLPDKKIIMRNIERLTGLY
jgi:RNA polymerase sigma-70 factor (ECF subfamily)